METGTEVGAIPEAHANVGAHGGVGQQGSTLPFLSIGIGSMVDDVQNIPVLLIL
jgi:hypothetical protein